MRLAQYETIARWPAARTRSASARAGGLLAAARGDHRRALAALGEAVATRRSADVPVRARADAARPRNGAAPGACSAGLRARRSSRRSRRSSELGAAPWALEHATSCAGERPAAGRRRAHGGRAAASPRSPHRDTATRRSLPGSSSRSARSRRTSPASTASSACDPARSSRPGSPRRRRRAVHGVGVSGMCRASARDVASAHPIRGGPHDGRPVTQDAPTTAADGRAGATACGRSSLVDADAARRRGPRRLRAAAATGLDERGAGGRHRHARALAAPSAAGDRRPRAPAQQPPQGWALTPLGSAAASSSRPSAWAERHDRRSSDVRSRRAGRR